MGILAGIVPALLIIVAATLFYIRSPRFDRYVLHRVTTEIENVTGGRVEVRNYQFHPRVLEAHLDGLVVHGLEADPAHPLLAADSVVVQLKIISLSSGGSTGGCCVSRVPGLTYSLTSPAIPTCRNRRSSGQRARARSMRSGTWPSSGWK